MRDTGGEIETENVEKESVVEVEKNAGKAVVNQRRERTPRSNSKSPMRYIRFLLLYTAGFL